ncbi:MAG: hypothetical protein RLZZ420_323 [Bacteroidota bacterium]|jgi:hypothetical protein
MINKKVTPFLNLLLFAGVVTVNALANILPINGYNTGQVSAFYPNFFVPAGFTFSIWGVIYLILTGFVVISFFAAFGKFDEAAGKAVQQASPWFWLTCVINASWVLVWHHLYLATSWLLMLAFLAVLIRMFLLLKPLKNKIPVFHRIWVYHAFVVYLAWISVATIANTTALLVGFGWQGGFLSPQVWSVIMICIAIFLGIAMVGKRKEPAYGFVLSWAFYGIYSAQVSQARIVGITAAIGVCVLLALTITILIKVPKRAA